ESPRLGGNGAGKLEEKGPVPCAQFDNGLDPPIGVAAPPCFRQARRMSHQCVKAAEVPSGFERARVLRWQLVQQFRFRLPSSWRWTSRYLDLGARHACHYFTSNTAPWQLKPAPNEEIHHSPPGAPADRAR